MCFDWDSLLTFLPLFPLLTHKYREIEEEMNHALVGGVNTIRPYLVLKVERSDIVGSTLHALALYESFEYKKKLKVQFRGEDGVDVGGVQKGKSKRVRERGLSVYV